MAKRKFTVYPSNYVKASSGASSRWKKGDYVYCEHGGWGTIVGFEDDGVLISFEDYDDEVRKVNESLIYSSADEAYNSWYDSVKEYEDKYPEKPLW